jgi:hypothetical protein
LVNAKCLILLLATLTFGIAACAPPTASSLPSTQSDAAKIEATAAKSSPADEGELLDEAWEAMYMQGGKVGYGHTTRRKLTSPEEARIRTSAEQTIVLKRYGQTTEQTIAYSSDETEDGKLLSLRADLSAGTMSLQSHGEVKDGLLQLTTITQGKRSTESIPWDDDLLGYFGLEDSLRRQPMKPGGKRRVKWLQPLIHQISDEQLEAIGEEEVDLLGEKKKLLKIKSTANLAGQTIESLIWTDAEGRAWRSSRPALGQETYRTTKEVATAKSEATFDLGLDTVVKITPPLERPHETRRVVYRARLKHGNPAEVFPSCGSQSVKAIDEHTAEITVERITATEPEKIDAPCPAPTDGDRRPNNLIQSDDPTVREMAKSIAPGEPDAAKLAIALESFVHEKVTNKNFSQAFSTAADVAKTLEGDCTEHAVLLAALCRSRNIPARVAAGLVYYAPEQGFAYHMWTEVWIADRWVPLDATLGRGAIGGAHLKLFDSDLDGIGAFGAFLPVMNVLGQLELEVVTAE